MDIDEVIAVPTRLNNLETDLVKLGVSKLQTFFVYLKKLGDIANNDVQIMIAEIERS